MQEARGRAWDLETVAVPRSCAVAAGPKKTLRITRIRDVALSLSSALELSGEF